MPAVRPVRRRTPAAVLATLALAMGAAGAGYTVQPGDTLSRIAARNNVTARDLAAANGITDPNRIVVGQRLALPGVAATHTVAAGETLARIAARYGVSQGVIADANNLRNRNIVVVGQILTIPSATSPAPSPAAAQATAAPASHTVRPGEHLARIAAQHGVTVRAIAEANGIRNPNVVQIGATLQIPGSRMGQPGVAPAASLTRQEVGDLLERTARRYGWSPAFVKAIAWQESGWNQRVVSRASAIGIMQVLPSTGQFVARHLVGRPLDLHNADDNVEAGVAFLDYLHRLTGGDPEMILAGYYQGLASVRANGRYADTDRYIANVLALRDRFR